MATIKASPAQIARIKKSEAFRAKPYDDGYGNITIGYGDTTLSIDKESITEKEASADLATHVGNAEKELSKIITRENLTQDQQDTLIDMHFNIGATKLKAKDFFKKVNKGDDKGVYASIGEYTKATNRTTGKLESVPGLVKRAKERQGLWGQTQPGPVQGFNYETLQSIDQELDQASGTEGGTSVEELQSIERELDKPPAEEGTSIEQLRQIDDELEASDKLSPVNERGPAQEEELPEVNAMSMEEVAALDSEIDNGGEAFTPAQEAPAPEPIEEAPAPEPISPIAASRIQSKDMDPIKNQQTRDIMDKYKVSEQEASAAMTQYGFSDVMLAKDIKNIDDEFPGTKKWASKPQNYPLLQRDPKWAVEVEKTASSFRDWKKDFKKGIITGGYDTAKSAIHLGIAKGAITPENGVRQLNELDAGREKHPITTYKKGIDNITNAFAAMKTSFGKTEQIIRGSWAAAREDHDKATVALMSAYIGASDSFIRSVEFAEQLQGNPLALGIISAQSAPSGAIPFALGEGGKAIGKFIPVPLASSGLGFLGGALGGYAVSYGQYISERAEEYINPKTGKVDYAAFYADKENLEDSKNKANTYALTHAGYEGITSVIGRGYSLLKALKEVEKATVKIGKVAKTIKAVKGLAKDTAVEMIGEGVGETTARVMIGEPAGESIAEGFFEGTAVGPLGAAFSVGGAAIHSVLGYATEIQLEQAPKSGVLKKVVEKAGSAAKARTDYNNLKKLRETKGSSEIDKQHPQQTDELIRDSIDARQDSEVPPSSPVDAVDETVEHDVAQAQEEKIIDDFVKEEIKIQDEAPAAESVVRINSQEWGVYHKTKGTDGHAILQGMGDDVVEAYQRAKETGGDFTVPMVDYTRQTEENPEIDDIVRFGDNEFNKNEGDEVLDILEKNFKNLMTPGKDDPKFTFEEGTPEAGDPVLRPIEIMHRFRNEEQKVVYDKLLRQIKKATKDAKLVSPEVAELMAEFQFRHVRMRAELLGRPITDVAADLKSITQFTMAGARGQFNIENPSFPSPSIFFHPTKADAPTVIHEFAHSWLDDMLKDWDFIHAIEDTKLTPKQRDYKEAMATMVELLRDETGLAIKTLPEIIADNARYVRAHEAFAQTSEVYFLDGTFKNVRIRKLFEAMRRWMKPFADIIGKTYVARGMDPFKITPKVERLFEILTDSSNKVEEEMSSAFPEPLFPPELLGDKAGEYMSIYADARDTTLGEIYGKITNRTARQQEREIEKMEQKAYEDAAAIVDEMKVMQVSQAFKKAPVGARISEQSFHEVLAGGNETKAVEIRKVIPKHFVNGLKKGGRDVREVMLELGINDPAQMIDFMMEANMREAYINRMADKIIAERMPMFKSDEEIHEIAVKEMNGMGRDKLLRYELETLADMHFATLKKTIKIVAMPADLVNRKSKDAIKDKANRLILSGKAFGFKPKEFLKESTRHGRTAAEALAKGDIIGAFNAKETEAIYFNAFTTALKVQRALVKTSGHIKRMLTVKDQAISRHHDLDIYNFGRNAARQILTNKPLARFDQNNFPRSVVIDPSRVSAINNVIGHINKVVEAANAKADTQTHLSQEERNARRLPVEAYLALGEVLALVRSASSGSRTVILKGKSQAVEQVAGSLAGEFGPRKQGDPAKEMNVYEAGLTPFRTLISGMFKTEKEFAQSGIAAIYNTIANAQAIFNKHKDVALTKLSKSIEAIAVKDKGIGLILNPFINRLPGKGTTIPIASHELGTTFTGGIGEVIGMILHYGSESGTEKFLLGGLAHSGPIEQGVDLTTGKVDTSKLDAFVQRLIKEGTLKKEHFDFAQAQWDFFKEHYPAVKEAIFDIYGYDMGEIKAKPIVTPWGTYTGGYVPASRHGTYKDLTESYSDFSIDDIGHVVKDLFPQSDIGFAKERTKEAYPLNLALEYLPTQYHRVLQAAYLKKPMYEIGKVLNHGKFRQAMEDRRPGAMRQIVVPWFNAVMAQQYSRPSGDGNVSTALDVVSHLLRKNMRIGAFFLNLSTPMKQYLGLSQAIPLVGAARLARASAKIRLSPGELKAEISKLSNRMNVRFERGQRMYLLNNDKLNLNGDWVQWTQQKIELFTYSMIQAAQTHVDTIIWSAALEQAKDMGITNMDAAVAHADNMVERTQMSSDIASRPAVLRGTEIEKLFADFATNHIATYGIQTELAHRNLDEKTRVRYQRQIKALLFTSMIPSLVSEVLSLKGIAGVAALTLGIGLSKGRKGEDEEDEYAKNIGMNLVSSVVDTKFPILGRWAFSTLQGKPEEGIPLFRSGKAIGRALGASADLAQGIDLTPSQVRAMDSAAVLITGFPILSSIAIPLRIAELGETPKDKKKREARRRRQLERAKR